jgi:hypothetical protein
MNVIFFTPGGADVSLARRASLAPLRRRGDDSQRFFASRRRLLSKDLNEGSERRAATGSEKIVQQSRITRASAQLRRIMVWAIICSLPVHFILHISNDRATSDAVLLMGA